MLSISDISVFVFKKADWLTEARGDYHACVTVGYLFRYVSYALCTHMVRWRYLQYSVSVKVLICRSLLFTHDCALKFKD